MARVVVSGGYILSTGDDMPFLEFGEWAPDQPSTKTDVVRRAKNVLWHAGAYRPLPGKWVGNSENQAWTFRARFDGRTDLNEIALARSYSTASGNAYGFIICQSDANAHILVFDGSEITELVDASGAGKTIARADRWNILQYGNSVVISSNSNPLIQVDFALKITQYKSLGGAVGELIAVVRDRLMHAGDPANPFTVRFTGINTLVFDPADGETPGGTRIIPDSGIVTGLTGGEVGHIFTESSINRATEIPGDPFVYQIDNVSQEVGCRRHGWAVKVRRAHYFLSEGGFMKLEGDVIDAIGHGRVDQWLSDNGGLDDITQRTIYHWDELKILIFNNSSLSSDGSEGTRSIAYNYEENRFTYIALPNRSPNGRDGISWRGWMDFKKSAVAINDPRFVDSDVSARFGADGSLATDNRKNIKISDVGTPFGDPFGFSDPGDPPTPVTRISDLVFGSGSTESRVVEVVLDSAPDSDNEGLTPGEFRKYFTMRRIGNGEGYEPSNAQAEIDTGEIYLFDFMQKDNEELERGKKVVTRSSLMMINEMRLNGEFYVQADGDVAEDVSVIAQLAVRDSPNEPAFRFGEMLLPYSKEEWYVGCFAQGRWVAVRVTLSGGWANILGVDLSVQDGGEFG